MTLNRCLCECLSVHPRPGVAIPRSHWSTYPLSGATQRNDDDDDEQTSIDVYAFWLTDKEIAEALVAAVARGVAVSVEVGLPFSQCRWSVIKR